MPLSRRQRRTRRPRHGVPGLAAAGLSLLVAIEFAPCGGPRAAPGTPAPPAPDPQLTEVAKVRLVLLPTSVTTRRGRPVRDLTREDFRLTEDGVARTIDLFATEEDAPVALTFLLDVSGSMRLGDRLVRARRAIRAIVGTLSEGDRVGLICFAEGRLDWVVPLDADRETFFERLGAQQPSGRTALYDALAGAPAFVDERTRGRKAIVLISDGVDNASTITRLEATWMARRVAVPIYALAFIPMREELLPYRAREALRVLERFSSETGGILFPVRGDPDVDRAAARIQDELRFQYVIGFYPTSEETDGSFRVLRLTTEREGLKVRTRSGYYARP